MKLAFIWQGITEHKDKWNDGLRAALKIIEKDYEVTYHEPTDEIPADAIVLYWEAPCTINGINGDKYKRVMNLPNKKALLFAGGQIKKEWMDKFDHVFVESKINEDECRELGIPYSRAFGVNVDVFKPKILQKIYDGIHHGTCAGWKRQQLLGESLGSKALIVGRGQESDPYPFHKCRDCGSTVLDEKTPDEVCDLINQSYSLVQTSALWGGGQRATLEAMACNVPVIAMSDSPKNREFVEESGFGVVCDPDVDNIRRSVEQVKLLPLTGNDYVMSKWTHHHYAQALLKVIENL